MMGPSVFGESKGTKSILRGGASSACPRSCELCSFGMAPLVQAEDMVCDQSRTRPTRSRHRGGPLNVRCNAGQTGPLLHGPKVRACVHRIGTCVGPQWLPYFRPGQLFSTIGALGVLGSGERGQHHVLVPRLPGLNRQGCTTSEHLRGCDKYRMHVVWIGQCAMLIPWLDMPGSVQF